MKKNIELLFFSLVVLSINAQAQLKVSENSELFLNTELTNETQSNSKKEPIFQHIDLVIGLYANPFLGKTSDFLKVGYGTRADLTFASKNDFYFGLGVNYFWNNAKLDYPFEVLGNQAFRRSTSIDELIIGKHFGALSLQSEFGYVRHSILNNSSEIRLNHRRINGFSPGVKASYSLALGKNRESQSFGSNWKLATFIDINLGIRHLFFAQKEINGFMLELGIGTRIGFNRIDAKGLQVIE